MPVIPSDPSRHGTTVRIACNGVPLPPTSPLIALDTRQACKT